MTWDARYIAFLITGQPGNERNVQLLAMINQLIVMEFSPPADARRDECGLSCELSTFMGHDFTDVDVKASMWGRDENENVKANMWCEDENEEDYEGLIYCRKLGYDDDRLHMNFEPIEGLQEEAEEFVRNLSDKLSFNYYRMSDEQEKFVEEFQSKMIKKDGKFVHEATGITANIDPTCDEPFPSYPECMNSVPPGYPYTFQQIEFVIDDSDEEESTPEDEADKIHPTDETEPTPEDQNGCPRSSSDAPADLE
jgi:hypothetical protein